MRLATEDARRPFDLKNGPLLRALLVRIDDEQFRLYMTVHQIIFDAVTAYRVFLPEWRRFTRPLWPTSPRHCRNFPISMRLCLWQRKRSSDHTGAKHIAYWRKQLAGELSPLEWPNDVHDRRWKRIVVRFKDSHCLNTSQES